jgi:hypothetical protein
VELNGNVDLIWTGSAAHGHQPSGNLSQPFTALL